MALRGVSPRLIGTNTNSNAGPGEIGEFASSIVLAGAAVSLTTGTAANVTSLSLTAGDWEVWGTVGINLNAATAMTIASAWVSSTSATLPTAPAGGIEYHELAYPVGRPQLMQTGRVRFSLAATTTVYLGVYAAFTINTATGYGALYARRAR